MQRRPSPLLTAALLAACASASAPGGPLPIPSRFELVSLNGQSLPAIDSVGLRRVLNGTIEFLSADTVRVIHTTRHLFRDHLPCAALRAMANSPKGPGGVTLSTDTSTNDCDELRLAETDTHVVAYARRGDRLELLDASVRVAVDTLVVEDDIRDVTEDGTTTIRTRTQRYVRVPTLGPSHKPQN